MAKSYNQHVVPVDGKWAVRGEGRSRATSMHDTQADAIRAARQLARDRGGEIVVHGLDGQIRERDTVRPVLAPKEPSTIGEDKIREAVRRVVTASAGDPQPPSDPLPRAA